MSESNGAAAMRVQLLSRFGILLAAAVLLTACGETRGERAVTGAGIGAGAGAVVGAITGLGPGTGAAIGATAGGIAGFLTEKAELNLGDAPWDSSDTPAAPSAAENEKTAATADTQPVETIEPAAGPQAPEQQAYAATPADRETIRSIQAGLRELGFDPGPADGIAGTRTRTAIRAFQEQNSLPVDGLATKELAAHIQDKLAAN